MNKFWSGVCVTACVMLSCALPATAQTQDYPNREIHAVVGFPAGSGADIYARYFANKLSILAKQPVIVENKPGAGGSLGAAGVAKSPPDGQTLLMVFDTHAVNHHLYRNLGYDGVRSFEHISQLLSSPQILVAATNFSPATLADLIAFAKANPGKVTYGSVGTGSSNHLNALSLASRTGITMVHVPYKGGAPMMQDLIGGQLNVMFVSAPQAIPQVNAGRIKALASGSRKRIPQLPDTPTVGETLSGFEAVSWVGVVAPPGTPKEIIARLHREFVRALDDTQVRERLLAQGFEIVGSTPDEFLRFASAESDKWAKVIRDFDIKVE
jgi:tripartite-type tricarboxylate transporter receptor subunit TctC